EQGKTGCVGGSGSHAPPLCTLLWAGGERDPGAGPRWDKTHGKPLGTCEVGILWTVSLLVQGQFEIMNMDMRWGTTLTIKGKIANDADGFSINLGQGTDTLDLHFNPRFDVSTTVCNSKDDNNWGQEQRNHMCFRPGSEVKLTVTFESDKFKIKLPDGHQLTFPNRMCHSHLSYLSVQGGFSLSSFKLD
ncbi:galectin-2, partial [Phyllostomus hastatus]|uniref:galectin-2 n=1 Tax=Phyllostomus hastatus TaxID=9423 RepID=UPI001E67EEB1